MAMTENAQIDKLIEITQAEILEPGAGRNIGDKLYEGLSKSFKTVQVHRGMRLPSNPKLAEKLGISHITLRKALKRFENEGIIRQITGKGTFLCSDFSQNPCFKGTLMVILPALEKWYLEMIDSIGRTMKGHEINISIVNADWEVESRREAYIEKRIDECRDILGIITSPSILTVDFQSEVELFRKIALGGTPVVFIDRPVSISGISSVGYDDISGMEKLFDFVWDKGYRQIYYVYTSLTTLNVRNSERFTGIVSASQKYNYNIDDHSIGLPGKNNPVIWEKMIKSLLEGTKEKTAFICSNDVIAHTLLQLVQEADSINNEILVAGYDNVHDELHKGKSFITTRRDRGAMGKQAAQIMIEILKMKSRGKRHDINELLDVELLTD